MGASKECTVFFPMGELGGGSDILLESGGEKEPEVRGSIQLGKTGGEKQARS